MPFVVTRVEPRGDRCTSCSTTAPRRTSIAGTVRLGAADVPYSPVKRGAFEARLSRAAAYQFLSPPS